MERSSSIGQKARQMIDGKRILAVIPARGGSVGVPDKNIRDLGGKALLAHAVGPARAVSEIDRLVVSTDSRKIKAVAESLDVSVIDRPAALATAEARTEGALLHALDTLEEAGEEFNYVVVLEPTSPFRSDATIRNSLQKIIEAGAPSLLALKETRNVVGTLENGFFEPWVKNESRRRQDRASKYVEASTIYVCQVDFLRQTGSLVSDQWLGYVVPEIEAIDINTQLDFLFAELVLSKGDLH